MKTKAKTLTLATFLLTHFLALAGETQQPELTTTQGNEEATTLLSPGRLPPLLTPQPRHGGILPEIGRRSLSSWWSSPAVPEKEFRNVSLNPRTGRAEGIILFSSWF